MYTLFLNRINLNGIIKIAKTKYCVNLLLQNLNKFYDLK